MMDESDIKVFRYVVKYFHILIGSKAALDDGCRGEFVAKSQTELQKQLQDQCTDLLSIR